MGLVSIFINQSSFEAHSSVFMDVRGYVIITAYSHTHTDSSTAPKYVFTVHLGHMTRKL
jgi:hypothetical protein